MTYISKQLRQLVTERASRLCEYCLFPQDVGLFTFEMEHIISEKHGGATIAENLALACSYCNRAKGTDLGSIDPETSKLVPFFNPRTEKWSEHFELNREIIVPLTSVGRVTALILQFNESTRLQERRKLQI
jgi:5-methylcytosine-specific restriction endonuclease McrA